MKRTEPESQPSDAHEPGLAHRLARAVIGEATDFSSFDDADLLRALHEHKTYALLHQARQQGTATGLSPHLVSELDRNARAFALLDLEFQLRTRNLLDLFDEHGIRALLIKGLPVAHRYYAASHLRHRVDIDVWVDDSDWHRLPERLDAAGYTVRWDRTNTLSSQQFTATVPDQAPQPVVFDVHRKLSNRQLFTDLFAFEACWARRDAVETLPRAAWTLDTPSQLILTSVHRYAHGRSSDSERLCWLLDAHLMFETLDPAARQALAETALATGTGTLCAATLSRARSLFGTSLDAELEATLLSRMQDEPAAALLKAGKLGWLLSDLRGQRGAGDKLAFLKETLLNQFR